MYRYLLFYMIISELLYEENATIGIYNIYKYGDHKNIIEKYFREKIYIIKEVLVFNF